MDKLLTSSEPLAIQLCKPTTLEAKTSTQEALGDIS